MFGITCTPQNSPISYNPATNTYSIVRTRYTGQIGCVAIVVLLCFLPLLPLVLPIAYMTRKTSYRPQPPAAQTFMVLVIGAEVLMYGGVGFIAKPFLQSIPDPHLDTGIMFLLLVAIGIVLALPAGFLALFYAVGLRRAEHTYLKTYIRDLEQGQRAQAEARARAEAEARARAQAEEAARKAEADILVRRSDALIVGQPLERLWNRVTARFDIGYRMYAFAAITAAHLTRHFLIVATTGGGKTGSFIRPLIKFALRNNIAGIFLDPKGYELDRTLFDGSFSLQPDERKDSIVFCLLDPVLAADRPLQAVRKLAEALIPDGVGENIYFTNAAKEAFIGLMFSHYVTYGQFPELSEVRGYMVSQAKRETLAKELLAREATETDPQRREQLDDALNLLPAVTETMSAGKDVLGGLRQALLPLATGEFKQYVTTNPAKGVTVRQILTQRRIVRFAFTQNEGEVGKALGKILIEQFTNTVLDPGIDKSFLKLCVIDEAQDYICDALLRGLTQARSNNAGYVLALQGLPMIANENARALVFGNCKNKAFFNGVGTKDAEEFSRFAGEVDLPYTGVNSGQSFNRGTSYNQGFNQGQSIGQSSTYNEGFNQNSGTNQGYGSNQGEATSYHRRPLWMPGEISQMDQYYPEMRTQPGKYGVVILDDGINAPTPQLMRFVAPEERAMLESRITVPTRSPRRFRPEQYVATRPAPQSATPPPKPKPAPTPRPASPATSSEAKPIITPPPAPGGPTTGIIGRREAQEYVEAVQQSSQSVDTPTAGVSEQPIVPDIDVQQAESWEH